MLQKVILIAITRPLRLGRALRSVIGYAKNEPKGWQCCTQWPAATPVRGALVTDFDHFTDDSVSFQFDSWTSFKSSFEVRIFGTVAYGVVSNAGAFEWM